MASRTAASVRDRTQEFLQITERLQKSVTASSSESGGLPSTKLAIQQKSQFAQKASEIGLGIHKTSTKLQKLAQLAKRTSMFDDPVNEINEITGIVRQDIQSLHGAIADLQSLSKTGGTSQGQHHSHTVVDNLRHRLKETTKEFKDVLTLRSEHLKDQNQRRQMFSSVPENGFQETEPLLDLSRNKEQKIDGGPSNGQQAQMQLQPQDSYLTNRAEAMQNVESTIVELGGIFQQLAHMVKEQGEMAVRIDENITETFGNVESAQGQLLKYLNNISSNRWLVMKIFFVLIVFLIVFVVFLV